MKQMLVIRKDLNMRKGKIAAQAAHASLAAVLPYVGHWDGTGIASEFQRQSAKVEEWLANSFTKICVSVDSEDELIELVLKAKLAEVIVAEIVDNGATEFNGVKTFTCIALGPDTDERLAPLTGGLKLL